ncbi:helix-turn-helix transcriptional regulator [Streptomyces sp. NBC_00536]|uniref:helix-turn-helix domain-containing protein n=1 Tax=Streptomyces sp. NBC_00536 TaxID=2975769 RepID=UPI002E814075|nr:helix-turn-helix transcriptional regulator [Streptomyces sp. NBC_00536]WUC79478.1 helix-turn-helix transcriptional regulator [Streptomyces sp. NBC_00536]
MNVKELNPGSSQQAAFGARLRSAREARGWTQDHLAQRTGYSSQHISAVETGRKSPTLRFSRSADRALDADDTFERAWREIRHGSLLEGFQEYVDYESRAVEIRKFEIGIIPGLLQTPEYAHALADSDVQRGAITAERAAARVALVAKRQAALERARPPMMFTVMDESCLHWLVGGPKVMAAQLERLKEFAARPNTVLQVAPFSMGKRRSIGLPVVLLTLPDRSVVGYAESWFRGWVDRESTTVLPVLTAFHQLQAEALSQAESVALIDDLRKGHM